MRSTQEFLMHAIELRSEFFYGCVFAGNFTSLSTVQSYLCGDWVAENSLIDIAKGPRNDVAHPRLRRNGLSRANSLLLRSRNWRSVTFFWGKTDISVVVSLYTHREFARVTITTSRHSEVASSSATAAPPTCPVAPRIITAKLCFTNRTSA
jgi:hypothetical protein